MSRKATRQTVDEIEKVTLIEESITPEPDPVDTQSWPHRRHNRSEKARQQAIEYKPKEPENPPRRFLLLGSNSDNYAENGQTVIFPSKNAAKRMRNRLNHKLGKHYYIPVPVPTAKEISAVVELEIDPDEAEGYYETGGWGAIY